MENRAKYHYELEEAVQRMKPIDIDGMNLNQDVNTADWLNLGFTKTLRAKCGSEYLTKEQLIWIKEWAIVLINIYDQLEMDERQRQREME